MNWRVPAKSFAPGQIIASNTYAVAAMARSAGGEAIDLGIARDDLAQTRAAIDRGARARMPTFW